MKIETMPSTWRDLQRRVAAILSESGVDSQIEKTIPTARGTVCVDVWAHDSLATPPQTYVIECKRWRVRANKSVVHAFRTVVGDSGANWGAVVSTAGFQRGAREAAQYSNLRLLTWSDFQELFVTRWCQRYFLPQLAMATGPIIEYCEPINSRVARKAAALSAAKRGRLKRLRTDHFGLFAVCLLLSSHALLGVPDKQAISPGGMPLPDLPLRRAIVDFPSRTPAAVLDAEDLRTLLAEIMIAVGAATNEFDALFGGRA